MVPEAYRNYPNVFLAVGNWRSYWDLRLFFINDWIKEEVEE